MGMMAGIIGSVVPRTNLYGNRSSNSAGGVQRTTTKKKYKRLNYNFKEVSGMILRAKTSVSTRQVVTHARTVVAMLRRRYGCGEYNDRDLEIAIVHAEKMVRIAKKKLKNMKAEELAERGTKAVKVEEELEEENSSGVEEMKSEECEMSREEIREMIRQMERELQELAKENSMDELTDQFLGGGSMSEEELEKWKKKHRCDEMRQIVEADMKYLKAMFQRMMQEQQEMASTVILEMSDAMTSTPVNISLPGGSAAAAVEGGTVDASV